MKTVLSRRERAHRRAWLSPPAHPDRLYANERRPARRAIVYNYDGRPTHVLFQRTPARYAPAYTLMAHMLHLWLFGWITGSLTGRNPS